MWENARSNLKTNIKGDVNIIVLTTTKYIYKQYMFNKISIIAFIATAGFLQDTKG